VDVWRIRGDTSIIQFCSVLFAEALLKTTLAQRFSVWLKFGGIAVHFNNKINRIEGEEPTAALMALVGSTRPHSIR